tara:strand:+ start:692 stop:943 length:252 start_codon:yes stop_codon:yes gene_type:complete
MPKYNGHKNWNHWNVSLWLFNEEGLYRAVCACVERSRTLDEAAELVLEHVQRISSATDRHPVTTPDGAPYTFTSIRAALTGLR